MVALVGNPLQPTRAFLHLGDAMAQVEFAEITRALVGYVMADATCPVCGRADECVPRCPVANRIDSEANDRMARARVAVDCYRSAIGIFPL